MRKSELRYTQWALFYLTSIYLAEDWGTKSAAYYCIDTFFIQHLIYPTSFEQMMLDKSEPTACYNTFITIFVCWFSHLFCFLHVRFAFLFWVPLIVAFG